MRRFEVYDVASEVRVLVALWILRRFMDIPYLKRSRTISILILANCVQSRPTT